MTEVVTDAFKGEMAVTKAVGPVHLLQVSSHVASRSLDEVLAAKGADQKIAWQMYMKADRRVSLFTCLRY
jgi:L-lactate dehydrogenase (cytochrome)